MKPSLQNHLTHLDRTLVALFNERARLFAEAGDEASQLAANVEDLLARSAGPFSAARAVDVFEALDRGCVEGGR